MRTLMRASALLTMIYTYSLCFCHALNNTIVRLVMQLYQYKGFFLQNLSLIFSNTWYFFVILFFEKTYKYKTKLHTVYIGMLQVISSNTGFTYIYVYIYI